MILYSFLPSSISHFVSKLETGDARVKYVGDKFRDVRVAKCLKQLMPSLVVVLIICPSDVTSTGAHGRAAATRIQLSSHIGRFLLCIIHTDEHQHHRRLSVVDQIVSMGYVGRVVHSRRTPEEDRLRTDSVSMCRCRPRLAAQKAAASQLRPIGRSSRMFQRK